MNCPPTISIVLASALLVSLALEPPPPTAHRGPRGPADPARIDVSEVLRIDESPPPPPPPQRLDGWIILYPVGVAAVAERPR